MTQNGELRSGQVRPLRRVSAHLRPGPRLLGACLLLSVSLGPLGARADKLVLRIKAANPIEKRQTVKIRSELPPRVGTNDVISAGGLSLGYDVKKGLYYVHGERELAPKEVANIDVEIRDIWTLPEADLRKWGDHAVSLAKKLVGHESGERADALRVQIEKNLQLVRSYQERAAIGPGVSAVSHIRAYEVNRKLEQRVKRDLGHLENLVLGAERDPGELIGEVKMVAKPKRMRELPPDAYNSAVIRVSVKNTSPLEAHKISIKRELPPEIKVQDVLDGGGLEVGFDPKSDTCYVFKDGMKLGPGVVTNFDVTVRDKWNINEPRTGLLMAQATNLLSLIADKETYQSVLQSLTGVIGDLETVQKETGPASVGETYVAFYRAQGDRLDEIEKRINRIESAIRPLVKTTRWGVGRIKPPSLKTTWLIIYIVLGFLAVMSLLFFLRWYGRSQAEKFEA